MASPEKAPGKKVQRTPESFDREMELTEHLAELRTRILRSILYVAAGVAVTWFLYPRLYALLIAPIAAIQKETRTEWSMIFTSFMEPFFVKLQVCAVAGIILVFPLLITEAWGFVAPALTRVERKGIYFVAPLCVALFAAGVGTALWVMPAGIRWFISYLPPGTHLFQKVTDYVLFEVKLLLVFGIVFQLPVVILFFAKVGLVNSRFLVKYWRQAIVVAALTAAIATPSNDAFTMSAMTVPVIGLYFLSILLVKMVEKTGGIKSSPADEG